MLRKTSLIDYPGRISAVIFFPGCNLRCPWCHNRKLVLGGGAFDKAAFNKAAFDKAAFISLGEALAHVEKRRTVLGGVVVSGGEPTLFAGLGELCSWIKSLGLRVKLDTNGLRPDVLERLINGEETRPDYIAMDLKIAPERYGELLAEKGAEAAHPGEILKRSAALIRSSGIAHEFRSIALPAPPTGARPCFDSEDRAALALLAGDSPWFIRPFVPGNCLDPAWNLARQIQ